MKINFDEISDDPELFDFAKTASKDFEKHLEGTGTGKQLELTWRRAPAEFTPATSGAPVFISLTMKLPDSPNANLLVMPVKFRQNLPAARTLFLRGWGDILQKRSHNLIQDLQKVE